MSPANDPIIAIHACTSAPQVRPAELVEAATVVAMTSEHIFYVIHRAGRWQVYDGDQSQPVAVQDSAAAASHWCRSRVAPDEQAVIYSGIWHPRRSA